MVIKWNLKPEEEEDTNIITPTFKEDHGELNIYLNGILVMFFNRDGRLISVVCEGDQQEQLRGINFDKAGCIVLD